MAVTVSITLTEAQLAHFATTLSPYLAATADTDPPRLGASGPYLGPTGSDPGYDAETCAEFVRGLGPGVVERGIVLYRALAGEGKIDSVSLAASLGLDGPSVLSGALTTALKRRADHLGLPYPFDGGQGQEMYGGITNPADDDDPERTHWADRDGLAGRMLAALVREHEARQMTVAERIERVLAEDPGLSDRELRERLGLRHQHVNAECRNLERAGRVERRLRGDGVIGSFPVV